MTQLTLEEFEGRESNKLLNFKTSHDDAPVSLIWKPRDIVAANNKITPQLVFLFISSQDIIPKIINERAPANAIIPKPYSSLKVNQEKIIEMIIRHENKWLILFFVSEVWTFLLKPFIWIFFKVDGKVNCKTKYATNNCIIKIGYACFIHFQ